MAALSRPELFIVGLMVLLIILIVVVLLADRLLKQGFWAGRPKAGRKKRASAGAPSGERPRASTAHLTRDYFSGVGESRPLTEAEKDFAVLYGEANKALNEDPRGVKASVLMKRIDEQYIRMLSFFTEGNNRAASLHMEHNYLWLKYRQRSEDDPNGAFMVLVQSLGKLMERHGVKPYEVKEFARVMERYEGSMDKLQQTKGFSINVATVGFFSFSARLNLMLREHPDPIAQKAIGKVVVDYVQIMLERHYLPMVQSHFLLELKVEHIQAITDQVEGLRRTQEATGRPDPEIHLVCHYLVCRLRMAQLRSMATLEPSPGRAQDIHEAHMRKLANDSAFSGSESLRWAAMLATDGNRSMLAQAEVVNLLAAHFQATYGRRQVLESWNTMEAVKRKVVQAVLEDRTPIAEELLSSCDEEWKVLNASIKEWLARQMRKTDTRADGSMLPANANEGNLRMLRQRSQAQARGIPEASVFRVLEAIRTEAPGRRAWPAEHRDLIKALTGRGHTIRRLEVPGGHYVGALIGPQLALLIKTTDDRIDFGTASIAVERCHKAGAREIVFCVNFSAELVTAEALRRFFQLAEKSYPTLRFSAVDAEDMTAALIGCLPADGAVAGIELVPNPPI